jgi:hypothetical protein
MSSEEAPSITRSFGYIRWLDDPLITRSLTRQRILMFGLLPIYCSAIFWFAPLLFSATLNSDAPPQYLYVLPFLSFLTCMVAVASLSFNKRTASIRQLGILVRADEQGLTWRHRRSGQSDAREIRVAWSDLRSFALISFLTTPIYGEKRSKMFVLDAGSAILAWGYQPLHQVYGESMTDDTPDLARLIVTHTNLPLRDATPLAAEIAGTASALDASCWQLILAPKKVARPAATIAGLDEVLRPPRAERRRTWIPVWLAFIPLVAYIIVSVIMATHP